MAWETTPTVSTLAEGEFTALISIVPKEWAHVQIERTDTGTTDAMVIDVQASIDNVLLDTVPLANFQIDPDPSKDIFSFVIAGVRFFRVGMTALGSTDTIVVKVHVLRDRGLVVP